mmetsp:Transcript_28677/g.46553  ORF Transcript_28677/g.46553 Transcript_28677/m.46553 type:complete len:239 (+) Transcript_28677:105-821(+)|eukprot:CAMPEP_0196131608 /NCGR_PEP_ID=MMETSP0910-20130528/1540_1 /TAXON_ID=49265 /ORGANISM="Thalassiosira rotula, Strain GSO102" /LENGTH=238 /DNA_ID=CAMNT_0041391087 /DNA_START=109 /DNA_END=825 /DNA_ORIENTATION=-
MAAILCESFGKILNGTCDAVGKVCALPFRACGFATGELTKVCRSPFCLYLSVALGLNLPPVVFTGMSWTNGAGGGGDEGCTSASNWMLTNALLCVINMAAAGYISQKITYEPELGDPNAAPFVEASVYGKDASEKTPVKPTPEKTIMKTVMESHMTDTRSRSLSRVKEILCYDPWVALYILVGIFFCVWQTVGANRTRYAADCGGDLDSHLTQSLLCGFLFISLGACTFACSLCCVVK